MKYLIASLLSAVVLFTNAQTKADTIRLLQQTVKLYYLDFTDAEADSMINNINYDLELYKGMHKTLPTNDTPYPFAFNPAPLGTKETIKKVKINWVIHYKMELPANQNDLAFYSIPQLASLLINKKITSVDLTKFFIARLKKWGDTLQCVITLTEDLALQQAKQADAEIQQGIYRGMLQGIPYGLKDRFAVKGSKSTSARTPYKD